MSSNEKEKAKESVRQINELLETVHPVAKAILIETLKEIMKVLTSNKTLLPEEAKLLPDLLRVSIDTIYGDTFVEKVLYEVIRKTKRP